MLVCVIPLTEFFIPARLASSAPNFFWAFWIALIQAILRRRLGRFAILASYVEGRWFAEKVDMMTWHQGLLRSRVRGGIGDTVPPNYHMNKVPGLSL